jgi:hypothetical protein
MDRERGLKHGGRCFIFLQERSAIISGLQTTRLLAALIWKVIGVRLHAFAESPRDNDHNL